MTINKITCCFSSKNRFQRGKMKRINGVKKFQWTDNIKKKNYKFSTHLSGKHNLYNVAAAICLAIEENISIKNIAKGLNDFQGVGRRFELSKIYLADKSHVLIDDYGHHPTEILSTILATKEKFPRKKICMIFEPQRYSRTQQLLDDFIKVLSKVDCLLLLDIYPESEKPIRGISSKKIASQLSTIIRMFTISEVKIQ